MNDTLPYDFSSGNTNPETYPGEALAEAAARVIPCLATALNTCPGKLGHEGLRHIARLGVCIREMMVPACAAGDGRRWRR